jgi:superfamily II DNA or RNA helicase
MASSDLAWKKLIRAQEKIEADDDKLNAELEALLAKRARLHKQRKLLRKRAGQFIQTDIKDVEELERLEEEEERKLAEERAKQETARKEQELIASMLNSGDANGLVVDDSSWLAAFSSPNQLSLDTPESCRGNSNS